MKHGSINQNLLIDECVIWRTPHALQRLHREEVSWDEFLRIFVEDIAFGSSPAQWIERLINEGNIGVAAEINASQEETGVADRINAEQEIWSQMYEAAKNEAEAYLKSNHDELSDREIVDYQESLDLAESYLAERAYGDAIAIMEQIKTALELSVARRRKSYRDAFTAAARQVDHARTLFAELIGIPASKFPGGERNYHRAKYLVSKASELILERNYTFAKQYANWAELICRGKKVPLKEIDALISSSHTETSSRFPENDVDDFTQPALDNSEDRVSFEMDWKSEEDEFLIDNYDVMTNPQLILRLHTSEDEIEKRIRYHGLKHERGGKHLRARFRNPYVAGKPLRTGKVFVGRDDVFQFIASALEISEREDDPADRNLIALFGHRRTGKTSLLLQLKRNMRSILAPRIPVFIDIESMLPFPGGLKNFFFKFASLIHEELLAEKVDLPQPKESDFSDDPAWQFRQFLHDVESRIEGEGLVLMMDEFQAIDPRLAGTIDRDVYKMLRSIIQHDPKVDFIISGTMQMERIMREYGAAMFGSALIKRIDFLDEQDARKLIVAPVSSRITYSKEAVDLIIEMTACHPYFVQLFCWTLVSYLIDRGKTIVFPQDVERVLPQVIEKGVHFEEIWATDTSELEQYIMAIVGEFAQQGRVACPLSVIEQRLRDEGSISRNPDDLLEAIQNLTGRRILRDVGDGKSLCFQVRVFGKWVNTNKPLAIVKRDVQAEAALRRRRLERQSLIH